MDAEDRNQILVCVRGFFYAVWGHVSVNPPRPESAFLYFS